MKKSLFYIINFCLVFLLCYTSLCISADTPLKTEEANISDIQGMFTLILYGGRFVDDLERVAIFDKEGDRYYFEPYAPDFDYKIKKSVPDKEIFDQAQRFVSFHHAFHKSLLSRILDKKGNIIGFELRPLYQPFSYSISDVLDVYYWLKKDGKVKVTIKLIQPVERLLYPGGSGEGSGGD